MMRKFFILSVLIFALSGCHSPSETVSVLNADDVETEVEVNPETAALEADVAVPDLIIVGEGGTSGNLFVLAAQTYQRSHDGLLYSVTSGDEFVQAVRDFVSIHGEIQHLEYFGHGNEVGLYVNQSPNVNGAVYANDPVLNQDYLAASIYELDPSLFTESGSIQFNGCNVASGYPEVNSLAQDFANHFDVPVVAPLGPTEFSSNPDVPQPIPDSNSLSSGYEGDVYMVPTYGEGGFVYVSPQDRNSSGFLDVRLGQSYEEAVTELVALGLNLELGADRFSPYKIISYEEAISFCEVALGDRERCFVAGHDSQDSLRNLRALQMLMDGYAVELSTTSPWHQSYIWWASQRDLLTEDFTNKRWYTRGEMAELTWNFIQYFQKTE